MSDLPTDHAAEGESAEQFCARMVWRVGDVLICVTSSSRILVDIGRFHAVDGLLESPGHMGVQMSGGHWTRIALGPQSVQAALDAEREAIAFGLDREHLFGSATVVRRRIGKPAPEGKSASPREKALDQMHKAEADRAAAVEREAVVERQIVNEALAMAHDAQRDVAREPARVFSERRERSGRERACGLLHAVPRLGDGVCECAADRSRPGTAGGAGGTGQTSQVRLR